MRFRSSVAVEFAGCAGGAVEREGRRLIELRFVGADGAPSLPVEAACAVALSAVDGRCLPLMTPAARVEVALSFHGRSLGRRGLFGFGGSAKSTATVGVPRSRDRGGMPASAAGRPCGAAAAVACSGVGVGFLAATPTAAGGTGPLASLGRVIFRVCSPFCGRPRRMGRCICGEAAISFCGGVECGSLRFCALSL